MKQLRVFLYMILAALAVNCRLLAVFLNMPDTLVYLLAAAVFLTCCIAPAPGRHASRRLKTLAGGYVLLVATFCVEILSVPLAIWAGIALVPQTLGVWGFVAHCLIVMLASSVLMLCGLGRVFGTSVQLGVVQRALLMLFWWMPLLNLILAVKACRLAGEEYRVETARIELDNARAENEICKTKYPLLLVHGVFFRDSRYVNYWGRIPAALIRNGATVHYGQQQSAASVPDSAAELAARIEKLVTETGCEKLNIIAHSKGGLDARYAISNLGADKYVASLTTINTPHQGCLFAEHLMKVLPQQIPAKLNETYNAALRKLGDQNPDFLAAVTDLTHGRCAELAGQMPDAQGILYESVGSTMGRAKSGQFPLNFSYPIVKKYDGDNDGLVALDCARWGTNFTVLRPSGKRGISHGDVIDMSHENIRNFDVREFYVNLVKHLKERGY